MAGLRLIAQGLSNPDITDQISVSEPTVRAHVSRMLGKLHLASRTQAALDAVREGLDADSEASTETSGEGESRLSSRNLHQTPHNK